MEGSAAETDSVETESKLQLKGGMCGWARQDSDT